MEVEEGERAYSVCLLLKTMKNRGRSCVECVNVSSFRVKRIQMNVDVKSSC